MESALGNTCETSLSPRCWWHTWSWWFALMSNNLQVPPSEPVPNIFLSRKDLTILTSSSWTWNVHTTWLAAWVSSAHGSSEPRRNIPWNICLNTGTNCWVSVFSIGHNRMQDGRQKCSNRCNFPLITANKQYLRKTNEMSHHLSIHFMARGHIWSQFSEVNSPKAKLIFNLKLIFQLPVIWCTGTISNSSTVSNRLEREILVHYEGRGSHMAESLSESGMNTDLIIMPNDTLVSQLIFQLSCGLKLGLEQCFTDFTIWVIMATWEHLSSSPKIGKFSFSKTKEPAEIPLSFST